ncbi:MAG: large repetitive protein, partial [Solirubrobacterales bacterium]|nr:large repetitive protein [Solirubrobacterales bacterium]
NATLNGANFTPGPEFVDSATEVWNTRFPSGNATSPFTVFYKQGGAPPETTIDSGPAAGSTITNRTPTFTFSSSEGGSSFACSVDGGPFTACDSPHTLASLADGAHTFEVRATDAAANADPTPASRSFTVDVRPPETTITKAPRKKVKTRKKKAKVKFEFTSTEPGSSFACSVDGGEFSACSSPHTLAHLADGSHAFAVTTIDAAGNSDPTPTSRAFTVDATAPHGTITKGPKKKVKTTHRKVKVTFKFTSPEPGVVFLCSMDGVAATPCDSPKTYKVGTGEHRFVLLTADAHDNIDLAGDSRVFKVKRMPKHH